MMRTGAVAAKYYMKRKKKYAVNYKRFASQQD